MPTVPQLRDVLRTIKLNKPPFSLDRREIATVDGWINDMILFIDNDPTGKVELEFNLEWILDRATDAVLRDGVRILVIDPWNEIEHTRARDVSLSDYIGRSIRTMRRWAQQYSVVVIVIAHPTKDVGKDGKSRPVTLYDIDGSAHWYNKPDHGVVVCSDETGSKVHVRKVRFAESGNKGEVRFRFDRQSKRYRYLDQKDVEF
jgi:twinkle protein